MPFVTQYVRLTNSGKLPEIFVTSKVQAAQEIQNAKLGKLFFLLQLNASWKQGAAIGSSIINIISREYFRQEGSSPLESFERALAKANRLLEQLSRDGETIQESLDAIIALSVGDELHVTATGEAEAYFIRDDTMSLITEPGSRAHDPLQTFSNIITGEISAGDMAVFGSPAVYEALTSEDIQLIMRSPLHEAGKQLARRIREQKIKYANAILLQFDTLRSIENSTTPTIEKTIYLDQPIDSTLSIIGYNFARITKPIGKLFSKIFHATGKQLGQHTEKLKKKAGSITPKKVSLPPALNQLGEKVSSFKLPTAQPKPKSNHTDDAPVPVNSYLSRNFKAQRKYVKGLTKIFRVPLIFIQNLGLQLRHAIRRSPRTWYIVIALLLLSSIGASIQTRNKDLVNPSINNALYDEIKSLVDQANDARAFGNNEKARQLLAEVVSKGSTLKKDEAKKLVARAESDLRSLAGATDLTAGNPLVTLPQTPKKGSIFEGTFYYVTEDGKLYSSLLTGGNPTLLAQLPENKAASTLFLDQETKNIYLQASTGTLYRYAQQKLKKIEPAEGKFALAKSINLYSDVLYLLDSKENQILKYSIDSDNYSAASNYLKKAQTLTDATNLAIDGSLFVMNKNGTVLKFARGNPVEFTLGAVPIPYEKIENPLQFFAIEDAASYYLADRGNSTTPPRIIEFDKTGEFIHQYFMPMKWQKDLNLVITNPKSHKAWAVVGKELYEFTLVQ